MTRPLACSASDLICFLKFCTSVSYGFTLPSRYPRVPAPPGVGRCDCWSSREDVEELVLLEAILPLLPDELPERDEGLEAFEPDSDALPGLAEEPPVDDSDLDLRPGCASVSAAFWEACSDFLPVDRDAACECLPMDFWVPFDDCFFSFERASKSPSDPDILDPVEKELLRTPLLLPPADEPDPYESPL